MSMTRSVRLSPPCLLARHGIGSGVLGNILLPPLPLQRHACWTDGVLQSCTGPYRLPTHPLVLRADLGPQELACTDDIEVRM